MKSNNIDFRGLKLIWFNFSKMKILNKLRYIWKTAKQLLKEDTSIATLEFQANAWNWKVLPKGTLFIMLYILINQFTKKITKKSPAEITQMMIFAIMMSVMKTLSKEVWKSPMLETFLWVWATDNLYKVTTRILMDNKTLTSASTPYTDLVYGTAENDCLVPCQTTEITSVFLGEKYESRWC